MKFADIDKMELNLNPEITGAIIKRILSLLSIENPSFNDIDNWISVFWIQDETLQSRLQKVVIDNIRSGNLLKTIAIHDKYLKSSSEYLKDESIVSFVESSIIILLDNHKSDEAEHGIDWYRQFNGEFISDKIVQAAQRAFVYFLDEEDKEVASSLKLIFNIPDSYLVALFSKRPNLRLVWNQDE